MVGAIENERLFSLEVLVFSCLEIRVSLQTTPPERHTLQVRTAQPFCRSVCLPRVGSLRMQYCCRCRVQSERSARRSIAAAEAHGVYRGWDAPEQRSQQSWGYSALNSPPEQGSGVCVYEGYEGRVCCLPSAYIKTARKHTQTYSTIHGGKERHLWPLNTNDFPATCNCRVWGQAAPDYCVDLHNTRNTHTCSTHFLCEHPVVPRTQRTTKYDTEKKRNIYANQMSNLSLTTNNGLKIFHAHQKIQNTKACLSPSWPAPRTPRP